LEAALALAGLHGWSQATVEARFHYREPGLYVLPVRVYRTAAGPVPGTAHLPGGKSLGGLGEESPPGGTGGVCGQGDGPWAGGADGVKGRVGGGREGGGGNGY